MKKTIFFIYIFFILTGCATYDPKVGMSQRQFDSMNALSFNGKPVFIEERDGFDIYQQYDAVWKKERGRKISNELDRYYYFKDKELVVIKSKNEYLSDQQKIANMLKSDEKTEPRNEQEIRQRITKYTTIYDNIKTNDKFDNRKKEYIVNQDKVLLREQINYLNMRLNTINNVKKFTQESNEKKKRDTDALLAAQIAQQAKEQCLGSGQIGICQSSSQNNIQFLCNLNPIVALQNMFNEYCYTTDDYYISTKMEVRNNTGKPVKDITFNCTQYARSGTALSNSSSIIYDIWYTNEVRLVSLKFLKSEQVQSLNCKAVNWK